MQTATIIHVLDWSPGMRWEGSATFCGIDGRPFGWPHDAWWVLKNKSQEVSCWRCLKAMKEKQLVAPKNASVSF